jgi:hypothetical protein
MYQSLAPKAGGEQSPVRGQSLRITIELLTTLPPLLQAAEINIQGISSCHQATGIEQPAESGLLLSPFRALDVEVARRAGGVSRVDGVDHVLWSEVVVAQLVGIGADNKGL